MQCNGLLFWLSKWIGELFASNVALYITKLFLADSTSSTGSSNSFYTSGKPRLCSSSTVNGSNQLCSYLADRLAADKIDLAAPPFSSKVSANKTSSFTFARSRQSPLKKKAFPGLQRTRRLRGRWPFVIPLLVPPNKYLEKGADWLTQGVNPIIKKESPENATNSLSSYWWLGAGFPSLFTTQVHMYLGLWWGIGIT